jgi:activator of HSP90 ATPase
LARAKRTGGVRNLKQSVTIGASPHAVYTTLVNAKEHAAFTGEKASLQPRPGGKFRHYGDGLYGYVLELVPDKHIVLAWRVTNWPKGRWSIADFTLAKAGKGTRLDFAQYGVPLVDWDGIVQGWKEFYWTPLKKYLEE